MTGIPSNAVYRCLDSTFTAQEDTFPVRVIERQPKKDHDLGRFLSFAHRVIADGNLILIDRPSLLPPDVLVTMSRLGPGVLIDSIGRCSGISPSTAFPNHRAQQFPIILGPHEAIRLVYAATITADQPSVVIYRALLPVSDFSAYRHLWDNDDDNEPPDVVIVRSMWDTETLSAFGAGQSLGQWHNKCFLHGDTHLGNFYSQGLQPALAGDLDNSRVLVRPPTAEECATDLLGFLATAKPRQWRAFRCGYYFQRRRDGLKVIALIQLGRSEYLHALGRGWTIELRDDGWGSNIGTDDAKALALLDQVLTNRAETRSEELYTMVAVRCYLLYVNGRPQEGFAEAQRAIDIAASISDTLLVQLCMAIAQWQHDFSAPDAARAILRRVMEVRRSGVSPAVAKSVEVFSDDLGVSIDGW